MLSDCKYKYLNYNFKKSKYVDTNNKTEYFI